ncbi:uncharacterized protein B0H18DRAFT_1050656 [Fomitopsis serialis]|uniref:uncharacterized protein n=1 Tax=Fomitopsis serialis TaxID=139415 RepID=UPI0020079F12|nr:uncharacterized protein B0H18DRAFT_1050656 [Neoantrodia serialis]KAH9913100.1 hypothetical protein B0H18DRAFT_1050656 [Neoantrodia serialis]
MSAHSNSDEEIGTEPRGRTLADEVRTAGGDLDAERYAPGVFEGTGLLSEYQLPPPEPDARDQQGPPLFAATDIALAVKWGITDYDVLAKYATGSRRVTRSAKNALSPVAERRDARDDSAPSIPLRSGDPAGAPSIPMQSGDPVYSNAPLIQPRSGDPVAQSAPRRNATPESEVPSTESSLTRSTDRESSPAVSSPADMGSDSNHSWQMVPVRKSEASSTTNSETRVTKRYFFPDWFDLSESDDPYGSIPEEWGTSDGEVKEEEQSSPTLPTITPVDYSEFDELISIMSDSEGASYEYSAAEDSDEEYNQLQIAIARSLSDDTRKTTCECSNC